MSTEDAGTTSLITLSAEIVAAYLSNNSLIASELPALIQSVYDSIAKAASPSVPEAAAARPEPAVPIKKSITPDYIISLEDGRKLKSLKRYLMRSYQMTPQQYREKWGLPYDNSMMAPNYSQTRSALARTIRLGGSSSSDTSRRGRKPRADPPS